MPLYYNVKQDETNEENLMAEIVSIVYKPKGIDPQPKDHYARVPLQTAKLVAGYGIEGDRKGGHPKRQLNVMNETVLTDLQAEGFMVEPGQMGEQMIVRGVDIDALPAGARVQVGDAAVIEVIEPRTGCDRFEAIQGKDPKTIQKRMGVMAIVVESGTINVGDPVRVLQAEGGDV